MPDYLKGLFGKDSPGLPGGVGKNPLAPLTVKAQRTIWPHFQEDEDGFVTPYNFDNDKCIAIYEENLQDLFEHFGLRHEGISMCAGGLAVLYDVKAGVEKNAAFYDKAIEYLMFSKASMEDMFGSRESKGLQRYQEDEWRIGKLLRKKQRRLEKELNPRAVGSKRQAIRDRNLALADEEAESMALMPHGDDFSPWVTEIRVAVGEGIDQIEFTYSDGTFNIFGRHGAFDESSLPKAPEKKKDPFGLSGKAEDTKHIINPRETFKLKRGEYIVGMVTHEKGVLNSCIFHLSSGRRTAWYEGTTEPRGFQHSYWIQKGKHMTGLKVEYGAISTPLELFSEPIEEPVG